MEAIQIKSQKLVHKSFLLQNHFNYLFHISDIHIRNSEERQYEFKLQFTRTFNAIKTHPSFNKETSLIIVTGDILDKGIRMTAIAIELLQLFVEGLTALCPTIIIPGNHDDKKDVGLSKLDSLTAVFNETRQQRPNLYYLKSSGIYSFGDNLIFGHTSVIDKQFIKATDIETSNRIKIALFHGLVGVSASDTYNLLSNYDFYSDDFVGYDKVLLGDVHKIQNVSDDRIWYAGSLIQKSFSEDRNQHGGLLVWNMNNTDKPEFIHIQNNHEFIMLNIQNGNIRGEACEATGAFHLRNNKPFEMTTLPKETSIRFKCDNATTHSHLDIIRDSLNTHTTIIEESRVWTDFTSQADNNTETSSQPEIQTDPFQVYLTKHFPHNIQQLNEMDKHYKTTHNSSSLDTNTNYGKWSLLTLSMENVYNYREQHTLCFKNLPHDIISIHGKNGSGKSKLVESIILALYGCCPKHVPHIVSHGKTKATTSLEIQLNNDIYIIKRTFKWDPKKSTKSNKTSIQIMKNAVDNTATDKYESEKSIELLFGTKQDLCDTHISKQGCHLNFIHKSERDQLALLKRIFNTTIYETIEKTVKLDISQLRKEIKHSQQQLEQYIKKDISLLSQQLEQYQQEIDPFINERTKLLVTQTENAINIEKQTNISSSINELSQVIKNKERDIISDLYSLDEIKDKGRLNKTSLASIKIDIASSRKQIEGLYENKHRVTPSIIDDIKILENKIGEMEDRLGIITKNKDTGDEDTIKICNKMKKNKSKLDELQQQKCDTLEKLDNNRTWTFSSLPEYKQFLKTATSKNPINKTLLQQLTTDIDTYVDTIANIDTDMSSINRQYKDFNNRLLEKEQTYSHVKDTLKKIKTIKLDLSKDRFNYSDACESCRHNKTINLIPEKQKELDELTSRVTELKDALIVINSYLQKYQDIPQLYEASSDYNSNISRRNILVDQQQKQEKYQQLKQEASEYSDFIKHKTQLDMILTSIQQTQEKEKVLQDKLNVTEARIQQYTISFDNYKLELQSGREQMTNHIQVQTFIAENEKLQNLIDNLHIKIEKLETDSSKILQENVKLEKMQTDHLTNNTLLQEITEKEKLIERRRQERDALIIIESHLLITKLKQMDEKLDTQKDIIRLKQTEIVREQENERKRTLLQLELETHEYDLELHLDYLKITKEYPLYINKKGIEKLEVLINQYLWNMTHFNIKIISTENTIEFLRTDTSKTIPIEYCSGFEKFAISLAIRLAMAKIHPFNSMNSLIIDEGFGVFDNHNLKQLPNMLETLKPLFRQIFIITHIDELQSELPHKINILTDVNGNPLIS